MFLVKSSGVSFLNSSHSVTSMQQSAFFKHSTGEEACLILFFRMDLALGMAAGSQAVMFAPPFRSWFMMGE